MKEVEKKIDKVDSDVKKVEKDVKLFAKFEGLMAEIIIILLVGICVGTIAGFWLGSLSGQSTTQTGTDNSITASQLESKVQDYLNTNLLTAEAKASGINGFIVGDASQIDTDVYELSVYVADENNVQQQIAIIYSTPNKLILGGGQVYDLNTPIPSTGSTDTDSGSIDTGAAYTQSDKPEVKLFIMSFCPYGIQAATAFQSAIELLNDKMNFQMGYVIYSDYAKGYGADWQDYCTDSSEKYCSMHGINEVKEDVRQMCIQKYAPDKFWTYLDALMTDYSNSQVSASNINDKWEGYATAAGIDTAQIKACADSEQDTLLAEQVALNSQYGIQGSPTAVINGTQYSGARTADAFKTAICSAFTSAPTDCDTSLSTTGGTSSGSC
jgi:hypothetical protein